MNYQDYIDFQTLLAKLRVNCFRTLDNKLLKSKKRDKNIKMIRAIDYLKNNTTLVGEEKISDNEYELENKEADILLTINKE